MLYLLSVGGTPGHVARVPPPSDAAPGDSADRRICGALPADGAGVAGSKFFFFF